MPVVTTVEAAVQTGGEMEAGVRNRMEPEDALRAVGQRAGDLAAEEAAGAVVEAEIGPRRGEGDATPVRVLDAAFEGHAAPLAEREPLEVEVQAVLAPVRAFAEHREPQHVRRGPFRLRDRRDVRQRRTDLIAHTPGVVARRDRGRRSSSLVRWPSISTHPARGRPGGTG